MYQEFYHNTIQSNYIKSLLLNTYIPTVPFTCNINHVTKGCTYIDNGYFVKAKVSLDLNQLKHDIADKKVKYQDYFTKFDPYIFGKRYVGLTTNYVSNTDMYDPETHFYLGQYLKAYKAYYGIDLFPYYNCFSDEYVSGVDLIKTSNGMPYVTYAESTNDNYKIISVPISLCQEYTIAIDCGTEVLMCPVFIGKNGILKKLTEILQSALVVASHPIVHLRENYIHASTSFNNPVYFFSPCIPGNYDKAQLTLPQYEKYLRLLIKLPISNQSSITILQGHYKNVPEQSDKLINLDLASIKELLGDVIEKNYTNDVYDLIDNPTLQYYGKLETILHTYPSITVLSTDTDPDTYVIGDYLKLNYAKSSYEGFSSADYNTNLIYPLPQPIIDYATLATLIPVGQSIPLATLLINWKDFVRNKEQFPGNVKFSCMLNGVNYAQDADADVTLDNYLTLRLLALGGEYNNLQYFNSAWSDSTQVDIDDITQYGVTTYNSKAILLDGIYQIKTSSADFDIIIDGKSLTKDYLININENWSDPIYIETETTSHLVIPWGAEFEIIYVGLSNNNIYNFIIKNSTDNRRQLVLEKYALYLIELQVTDNTILNYNYNTVKNLHEVKFIAENPLAAVSFKYIDWIELYKTTSKAFIEDNIRDYLNNYLYNNLSLLYLNDQKSYAFVSRLIEYLTNNVITHKDKFTQNIKTIQKYVDTNDCRYSDLIISNGLWTNELRISTFEIANKYREKLNYPSYRDINGFVDKDSELAIKNYYNMELLNLGDANK